MEYSSATRSPGSPRQAHSWRLAPVDLLVEIDPNQGTAHRAPVRPDNISIQTLNALMATFQRSELEQARFQLSDGLLRLREQSDLVERLFLLGRPTANAKELLRAMQNTVNEMRQHIDFLLETTDEPR